MTFEISMTHKFDKELTDIDKAHINLGVISLDFITLVCERDGVTKVFDLPFNACSSSKNEDYLSDKYGCAGHHFTDCVIYNEDTGEELPIPDIIPG